MFGFIKVKKPEPRGFNYKPRYFDAEKEALRAKIKEAELKDSATVSDEDREMVKVRIREELKHAKSTSRRDLRGLWQGGNVRMFAILAALILFFYIVLNKFLPVIIQMLFPEY